MSSEEFEEAARGRWSDSDLVLGDPTQSGRKWLWESREAATRWFDRLREEGEINVIARVPTLLPIDAYESFEHDPEGTAVHVPMSELGLATLVE